MIEFSDAIRAAGLEPPIHIEPGRMIRFPGIGKGAKNKAAWCRLFDDRMGGVFGDYSSGLYEVWQSRRTKTYTPDQRAEFMRQVDANRKAHAKERERNQEAAAQKAAAIIKLANIEPHAYLDAHGLPNMEGLVWYPKKDQNLLVVPMYVRRDLVGCQLIDRDGKKKFLTGQRCDMAEHIIGTKGTDWLVEGYCTGLALHNTLQALKIPARIHVTFSAGNLTKIGLTLKKAFVMADHDKSGVGMAAAKATGHRFYLPEIEGEDWCDVWQRIGAFRSSQKLRKFLISAQKTLAKSETMT